MCTAPHAPFLTSGLSTGQPDGAMLWVYNCGTNTTQWSDLIDYLNTTAKPAGVTSVSICAYRIKAGE
jgi:GH24 family phage-related lysozyme (muramidase)